MATTYSANLKLGTPAPGDRLWNVPLNANRGILDAQNAIGDLCVSSHEQPSSSLLVDISSGQFIDQSGAIQTYAGVTSQAIAATAVKTLYLDGTTSWALVVTATSYPTTPHVRIATVTTSGSVVSSIVDNRQCFPVAGSIRDGVNWTFGTTTGTQIGTATSQKIGFYGKTPVVQPTVGATTAGATYTSAEQGIINALVAAVRALGLGS